MLEGMEIMCTNYSKYCARSNIQHGRIHALVGQLIPEDRIITKLVYLLVYNNAINPKLHYYNSLRHSNIQYIALQTNQSTQ